MNHLIAAVAVAVGLTITACGSSTSGMNHGSNGSNAVVVPAGATFNAADVTFAQQMIPHHEQAVEMATVALANTTNPQILALATSIKGAQQPEIATMTAWLTTWGQPQPGSSMDDMGMGMMSAADMTSLGAANGSNFDTMFLDMMIRHHTGAIDMAQKVQKDGKSPEVKALAGGIIEAQRTEITTMKGLAGKG